MYPKRIFSGIQPTGDLHIGNYLGAVIPWIELQNSNHNLILMIADLHSLSVKLPVPNISSNILRLLATLYGCGLDPDRVLIFQQSCVNTHCELNWYLSCCVTMSRLSHLPQFEEKSKNLTHIPLGLYIYPVLQAADILAYKATHVPVGEDQAHHVQLAQGLAKKFNLVYGETFPVPDVMYSSGCQKRVKSLHTPEKKMSKSDLKLRATLNLLDTPDRIRFKLIKATTDLISRVEYKPNTRPGISNLVGIHAALSGKTVQEICSETENIDTGRYKLLLAEFLIEHFAPIQDRVYAYLEDTKSILRKLEEANCKAQQLSSLVVNEVKRKIGLDLNNFVEQELKNKFQSSS